MNPQNEAELEFDSATFCGVARLFPLPNLVLYPHVMQPLHVFEERYRELMQDALASDRLIAMALLKPGWEMDYDSRPPIASQACLGKIVAHHRLEDGRYNLLLLGVQRVRIRHELAPLRSFRQAEVELVEDCYDSLSPKELQQLHQSLLRAFEKRLPCACQVPDQLEEILSRHLPLGVLTDLAAYALPLDEEVKQQLLAERRVACRAETLLAAIKRLQGSAAAPSSAGKFPPSFSCN